MNAKAYIITILISSILLINCSKINENLDDQRAVSFSSTAIKDDWSTKARVDNLVETLGVMAFINTQPWANIASSTAPNLMYDGTLSNDVGNWVVAPTIYWSSKTYLSNFFAYSPKATADNGITLSTQTKLGIPQVSYQMPLLARNQPALMLASPVLNQNYETNQGKVALELKRALAAIGFQIKGDTILKVKSIGIRNIVDQGTTTMNSSDTQWTSISRNSTTIYNIELILDQGKNYLTPTPLATNITTDNGYIMAIPQELQGAEVVLTTGDTNKLKVIAFPNGSRWETNKQYIYIITLLSSGDITLIIKEWNSTDDEVVDTPL